MTSYECSRKGYFTVSGDDFDPMIFVFWLYEFHKNHCCFINCRYA